MITDFQIQIVKPWIKMQHGYGGYCDYWMAVAIYRRDGELHSIAMAYRDRPPMKDFAVLCESVLARKQAVH